MKSRSLHLDAGRGAGEKRTEPYSNTVKGVSQAAKGSPSQEDLAWGRAKSSAKSAKGILSSPQNQPSAVQVPMEFVDTHCHIQFADYPLEANEVIEAAKKDGVTRLLAVGCTLQDSREAVAFAKKYDHIWASIGLHPHEGSEYVHDHHALQQFRDLADKNKVVAIGETGLDYYYENSPKEDQKRLLRFQLDLAAEHGLPLIFHVRDAFDDFWPIFDEYSGLKGVIHSFNSDIHDLEQILARGLYVGLNGIMTFTKQEKQLEAAKSVPLDKLLLETDAPFLTPMPFRGKVGEPKYVRTVGEFLADLRGEKLEDLASMTTQNARRLFKI